MRCWRYFKDFKDFKNFKDMDFVFHHKKDIFMPKPSEKKRRD